MSTDARERPPGGGDAALGIGLLVIPVIALFGVGFGWSEALRYARLHPNASADAAFLVLAMLAFVAFGFVAALWVRRQRLALLLAVPFSLWLATVVPFQAQAQYNPGCSSYTGSEPPPNGEAHDMDCELGYGMGASFAAVAETALFAIGLGIGAVVTQYRGRERRSGGRSAS